MTSSSHLVVCVLDQDVGGLPKEDQILFICPHDRVPVPLQGAREQQESAATQYTGPSKDPQTFLGRTQSRAMRERMAAPAAIFHLLVWPLLTGTCSSCACHVTLLACIAYCYAPMLAATSRHLLWYPSIRQRWSCPVGWRQRAHFGLPLSHCSRRLQRWHAALGLLAIAANEGTAPTEGPLRQMKGQLGNQCNRSERCYHHPMPCQSLAHPLGCLMERRGNVNF